MTTHEFDLYYQGYKDYYYMDELNRMSTAYYTGMFGNSNSRKIKSLEYYLNQIHKKYRAEHYRDKPVDVEKSRNIAERIEQLKRKRVK